MRRPHRASLLTDRLAGDDRASTAHEHSSAIAHATPAPRLARRRPLATPTSAALGQRRHGWSSGIRTLLCRFDHLAGRIADSRSGGQNRRGSMAGIRTMGHTCRGPLGSGHAARAWSLGEPSFGIACRPKFGHSPIAARPPRPCGCATGKHRGLIEPQTMVRVFALPEFRRQQIDKDR
jgi:hypothetical protein